MKNNPLVSVVIATYNMAAYLPMAIQSVLSQTYQDIELLVVDDGSTDDTREVLKSYLENSRIHYFCQENSGQAAAKNHGVQKSNGQYVAFLDADDMWMPEKLDLQIPLFSRSQTLGVVYARHLYIDQTGRELSTVNHKLLRGRITGPLLIANLIPFGTSIVKKECFERLGGFKENMRMGIDYDLWLRFSTQYEFDYVDRPLLRYRVWPGQMSNNCMGRYRSGIDIMKNFLREFPGFVDKNTEKEAWAHTFVGYGKCMQETEQRIGPAVRLYAQALKYKPGYIPAWKSIIKAMLNLK